MNVLRKHQHSNECVNSDEKVSAVMNAFEKAPTVMNVLEIYGVLMLLFVKSERFGTFS